MKYSLREYEIRRIGGRKHCFAVDEFLCCAKGEIPALRTGANLKDYCPSNPHLSEICHMPSAGCDFRFVCPILHAKLKFVDV